MSFTVDLPCASVLFTTREGGVSKGAYESLNLGLLTGDDRSRVLENRQRLAASAEVPATNVVMGWQVHGTDIQEWHEADDTQAFLDPGGGHLKVDGHITTNPDLAALVLVADCLPVALAGDGVVAMLHCGWRPLAGGIVSQAVAKCSEHSGRVASIAAAIGPGIGPCCYEVGAEVLDAFADLDGVADGRMLNLRAVAEQQLRAAGVERIEHVDHCTSCREDLFFSHRRDRGVTGRQGGMVWLSA